MTKLDLMFVYLRGTIPLVDEGINLKQCNLPIYDSFDVL
jgi:hypothetical protein